MKKLVTVFLLLLVLFAIPVAGKISEAIGRAGSVASNATLLAPQRIIWVRRHRRRRHYRIVVLRPRRYRRYHYYRYRRYRY